MIGNSVPLRCGGALVCTLKRNESSPYKTAYIKYMADTLKKEGYFIGGGDQYLPTIKAFKALKIQ